jgi:hypothetical protein
VSRRLRFDVCPIEETPECEADDGEDPCRGCPAWGIECGALWVDLDTGEQVRAEDITEDPHERAGEVRRGWWIIVRHFRMAEAVAGINWPPKPGEWLRVREWCTPMPRKARRLG